MKVRIKVFEMVIFIIAMAEELREFFLRNYKQ